MVVDVPVEVLTVLGGAATWRQLRQAGVGWYALWLAMAEGSIHRVRRGVYALATLPDAVLTALALGGVLSCAAAAVNHGLPVLDPSCLHVVVPRERRAAGHGVCVHRRDLRSDEQIGVATSLLRTVLDCARELDFRDAVAICDAALRRGLDRESLRLAAVAARGPGSAAIRRVVAASDPRAESPIESCLRLIARQFGRVDPQVWISGIGRVDLLVNGWLVLEADGFAHHSTREHYRKDRRRNNALAAAGYVVLRFTYEDVLYREDYVVATIRETLRRGRPGVAAAAC